MKDLKLVRINNITANVANKFEFDVEGFEFLVKNFNDFAIYVAFKNTTTTSEMIKIPANCGQVCVLAKESNTQQYSSSDVYIYAESSGEVEVQCLKF